MFNINVFKKVFKKLPFLKNYIYRHDSLVKAYAERFSEIGFPPGHYYSPIPSIDETKKYEHSIFDNDNIQDIDFNLNEQFNLLEKLKTYYQSIPYDFFETGTSNTAKNPVNQSNYLLKYSTKNAWYRYSDVIFLTAVMQYFKPKKIIEIGSGHSSAVMLDTNEIFFTNSIDLTFIEPFPEERLSDVLKENNNTNIKVISKKIQDTETGIFESLENNDILFIDTSHISKAGSDVNYIFFNILPVLKTGVLIHFHDIFYPFELPKHWILENKWFWNEVYLLRAFLMNNSDYKIVLFNSLLHKKYKQWFENEMPACLLGSEETGSIWIRKLVKNFN